MDQSNTLDKCPNCDNSFDTETQKYCSHCGQLRQDKLTVFSLFKNAMNSFFSFDSKLTRTIIPFLNEPGELAKQYIAGRRKSFLSPFQMYVFFSFLLFFVGTNLYFKDWDKMLNEKLTKQNLINEMLNPTDKQGNKIDIKVEDDQEIELNLITVDSLINEGYTNEEILDFIEDDNQTLAMSKTTLFALFNFYRMKGKGAILVVLSQLSLVLIFSLVINSLFLYLMYRRQQFTLAEQLVFSAYNYAFAFFVITLFFIVNKFLPEFRFWFFTVLIILLGTFYISLKNVFGQGWKKTLLKFSLFFLFSVLIVFPISILLLGALSVSQLGQ